MTVGQEEIGLVDSEEAEVFQRHRVVLQELEQSARGGNYNVRIVVQDHPAVSAGRSRSNSHGLDALLDGSPSGSSVAEGDQPFAVLRELLEEGGDLQSEFLGRHQDNHPRALVSWGRCVNSLPLAHAHEAELLARLTDLASMTFWTAGTQYAAVFPEPVRARAKTSLPSSSKGIALAWTRVGWAKERSARARRIRGSSEVKGSWLKVMSELTSQFCSARLLFLRDSLEQRLGRFGRHGGRIDQKTVKKL